MIIKFYANRIRKGYTTIKNVPEALKAEVLKELESGEV